MLLYAIDIKLLRCISEIDDYIKLQASLDSLTVWCQENQLTNVDKCKIMSFTRRFNNLVYNYTINGNVLQRCNQIVSLRIVMDPGLSFSLHINHIII